jgi:hypothetical protein
MKVVYSQGKVKTLYRVINDLAKPRDGERVLKGGISPDDAKRLIEECRLVDEVHRL